ncbi:alanine racemase [Asanoa sp. NPDC050611]|uniref:alanine racemase n=1 Tax=Asanoa sp. NPDC050611 TaxID=3157098 RepID=UPI0033CE3D98
MRADFSHKGLPDDPSAPGDVFDGTVALPRAVLLREALDHNIATMARYCAENGVLLAPHGKTTMSPQLIRRQLDAGAWAVTVATAWQARTLAGFGFRRLLLANEVVDAGSLTTVDNLLAIHPDLELYCYADSPAALAALENGIAADRLPRLRVLVELGMPGGRTGLRDDDAALALARAVAKGPATFAGIAAFEGIVAGDGAVEQVDHLLRRMVTIARAVADERLTGPDPIVTVGGSAYFDRVVALVPAAVGPLGYRTVLRSGCYVTHDAGTYAELSPFGDQPRGGYRLREALLVWAVVLSTPEPGTALAGLGRRDASADAGLPVPRWRRRGTVVEPFAATVFAVNDQHAYLRLPPGSTVEVGDLVAFGISHPCTTFDKWTGIPIVEPDGTFTEIAYTYF